MSVLKIDPADNVVVALTGFKSGETADIPGEGPLKVLGTVGAGHKLAAGDIPKGAEIIKYGHPIGRALENIKAGEFVHSHNLKTGLSGELTYTYEPNLTPPEKREAQCFKGYRRADGKAGVRNEIWVIPTVGCVNEIGGLIAKQGQAFIRGSVEGVYAFSHPYGCSQLGEDHENTMKALCGLINHPNAGGVLVLGLGCENNGIAGLQRMLGETDPNRVKFLVCQNVEDELEAGVQAVQELAEYAAGFEREEIPMSELIVGLKCGGSDGLSGITANPLVGEFSDMLISQGGTAILTEVPEMFGAETILMNRCENEAVFEKTVALINGFKAFFTRHGQPVYENPSPGNRAGGITTLEDKSLGCTRKAGRATVVDVLEYAQPVTKHGLNLLNGPGNDLVSSTAMAVSGAHLILFTTGRGTPFGAPVPTVKIASNTALANKKPGWVDFNAGALAENGDMAALAQAFYTTVREIASGERRTRTEEQGIKGMAIFKSGITL